ncbi:L,D-transpeptidase family protein [Methylogaea oryzae]|uniref:L,D-transpeptidase family protein n=1 Tax=Methylogaea oryzae TaxID=1295382 RepID=UPI0006D0255F|nr:L,D-transpeptidase family protein [Methylogaea oryzae]
MVGGQTLLQLNMTPANRLDQLRLGMERLRWLPDKHDGTFLVVNVPSFRLYGFSTGSPNLAKPDIGMNVIVGQAIDTRNTPVFQADMLYLVFRPYWNVPYSIARKELVPLIERDGGYIEKNDMEIVDAYGAAEGGALEASAENIEAVYGGKLRLRQRPGAKNALGPIKFVFPNMNSVYLHGTPQQRLFLRTRRDFSHGCIRVEDPASLAEFVLKKQDGWDKERIESSMKGDKSFTLRLGAAVPVYIFYTTALADEQGQVQFYPDIYGQDTKLLKLL